MKILGLSAFYHDSACALIDKGELSCAVQEERWTRKKHDASFPIHSIRFCLNKIISDTNTTKKSYFHSSKNTISEQMLLYQSALKQIDYIVITTNLF